MDTKTASTLNLDFQPSELWEMHFSCYKVTSLHYSVIAAQENQDGTLVVGKMECGGKNICSKRVIKAWTNVYFKSEERIN